MENETQGLAELTKALVAFQRAMPAVPCRSTGQAGTRRYKYANLLDIWDAIKEPLAANGLAVSQIGQPAEGDWLNLKTILMHISGQAIHGTITMPASGGPQAVGSALTYARRYGLSAILGLVTDEDDDGSHAQNAHKGQQRASTGQRPHEASGRQAPPADSASGQAGVSTGELDIVLEFGKKHRGKRLSEIPSDYIEWMLTKCVKLPSDLRAALEAWQAGGGQGTPAESGGDKKKASPDQVDKIGILLHDLRPGDHKSDERRELYHLAGDFPDEQRPGQMVIAPEEASKLTAGWAGKIIQKLEELARDTVGPDQTIPF